MSSNPGELLFQLNLVSHILSRCDDDDDVVDNYVGRCVGKININVSVVGWSHASREEKCKNTALHGVSYSVGWVLWWWWNIFKYVPYKAHSMCWWNSPLLFRIITVAAAAAAIIFNGTGFLLATLILPQRAFYMNDRKRGHPKMVRKRTRMQKKQDDNWLTIIPNDSAMPKWRRIFYYFSSLSLSHSSISSSTTFIVSEFGHMVYVMMKKPLKSLDSYNSHFAMPYSYRVCFFTHRANV
jgi:hypothetical protein